MNEPVNLIAERFVLRILRWFASSPEVESGSLRLPGLLGTMDREPWFAFRGCNRCRKRFSPKGVLGLSSWLNCSECRAAIAKESEESERRVRPFRRTQNGERR